MKQTIVILVVLAVGVIFFGRFFMPAKAPMVPSPTAEEATIPVNQ